MRIVHVSNGNAKHCGKRYYDQARKITNGLIRNKHDVFFISDRDIARASNIFKTRTLGVRAANRYFIETCKNYAPEMILLGHADIISPESVECVKAMFPQVKVAQWNVDPIFRPHNIEQIKRKLPVVDATFVTTAGKALKRFSVEGKIVSFFPNIVDASIEWPQAFGQNNQENDVFWALRATKGSFAGDQRIEIPLFIENDGRVSIDYHGMNGKGELFNHRYFDAIQNSKIGLNISVTSTYGDDNEQIDASELYLYSSDRISHYMGSGLLLMTTRDNKLEELLVEDEEIVLFNDKEELFDKLVYFKAHDVERQRIAKNGWHKVHRDFNEQMVARYMVEVTMHAGSGQGVPAGQYAWPTEGY